MQIKNFKLTTKMLVGILAVIGFLCVFLSVISMRVSDGSNYYNMTLSLWGAMTGHVGYSGYYSVSELTNSMNGIPLLILIVILPVLIAVLAFVPNLKLKESVQAILIENLSLIYLIYLIIVGATIGTLNSTIRELMNSLYSYYDVTFILKLTFGYYLNFIAIAGIFVLSLLVIIGKLTWDHDFGAKFQSVVPQQPVQQSTQAPINTTSSSTETVTPTTPKKYCTQCGAPLKLGVKFCTQCGAKLEE